MVREGERIVTIYYYYYSVCCFIVVVQKITDIAETCAGTNILRTQQVYQKTIPPNGGTFFFFFLNLQ